MTASRPPGRPPTSRGLPVLGVLPALRRDVLPVLDAAAREAGGEVVRLAVPGRRLFLATRPEHVRHVLVDAHAKYRRTPFHDRLKPVMGEGLVTSEGELWRRQRRLLQPAFGARQARGLVATVAAATADLAGRWERLDGAAVDVAAEMSDLALAVLARALLADATRDPAEIRAAVLVLQEGIARRFWSLWPWADGRLPTPANRRFRRAVATLDAAVERILAARADGGGGGERVLLDLLLAARDPETGEPMAAGQVRDEVMTAFLAGHETSAAALAWTWHLAAEDGAALDGIREEAAAVLGDGAAPTPDRLERLAFTRSVLEEAMRLYPPVPWFGRLAAEPDEVGGRPVPAGAIVLLSPWVTQRDPRLWPEPGRFDPGRFAPARGRDRPAHAYFPFGGGPRTCVGRHFAMTEMLVVLATLAPRFDLLPAGDPPPVPRALVTLRPAGPLRLRIRRRR